MIIGLDYDGTLVKNWTAEPLPGVRERLRALPRDAKTFIATNQAGPVFRAVLGDTKYPTVEDVADRIALGLKALDWRPDLLLVAVHSGKDGDDWRDASNEVGKELSRLLRAAAPRRIISAWRRDRKPEPGMLRTACVEFRANWADALYIGDMDTDEQAARAAHCRFQHVDSWLMEQSLLDSL